MVARKSLDKPAKPAIPCNFCGRKIPNPRFRQRYCSRVCNWAAWDKRHPRT